MARFGSQDDDDPQSEPANNALLGVASVDAGDQAPAAENSGAKSNKAGHRRRGTLQQIIGQALSKAETKPEDPVELPLDDDQDEGGRGARRRGSFRQIAGKSMARLGSQDSDGHNGDFASDMLDGDATDDAKGPHRRGSFRQIVGKAMTRFGSKDSDGNKGDFVGDALDGDAIDDTKGPHRRGSFRQIAGKAMTRFGSKDSDGNKGDFVGDALDGDAIDDTKGPHRRGSFRQIVSKAMIRGSKDKDDDDLYNFDDIHGIDGRVSSWGARRRDSFRQVVEKSMRRGSRDSADEYDEHSDMTAAMEAARNAVGGSNEVGEEPRRRDSFRQVVMKSMRRGSRDSDIDHEKDNDNNNNNTNDLAAAMEAARNAVGGSNEVGEEPRRRDSFRQVVMKSMRRGSRDSDIDHEKDNDNNNNNTNDLAAAMEAARNAVSSGDAGAGFVGQSDGKQFKNAKLGAHSMENAGISGGNTPRGEMQREKMAANGDESAKDIVGSWDTATGLMGQERFRETIGKSITKLQIGSTKSEGSSKTNENTPRNRWQRDKAEDGVDTRAAEMTKENNAAMMKLKTGSFRELLEKSLSRRHGKETTSPKANPSEPNTPTVKSTLKDLFEKSLSIISSKDGGNSPRAGSRAPSRRGSWRDVLERAWRDEGATGAGESKAASASPSRRSSFVKYGSGKFDRDASGEQTPTRRFDIGSFIRHRSGSASPSKTAIAGLGDLKDHASKRKGGDVAVEDYHSFFDGIVDVQSVVESEHGSSIAEGDTKFNVLPSDFFMLSEDMFLDSDHSGTDKNAIPNNLKEKLWQQAIAHELASRETTNPQLQHLLADALIAAEKNAELNPLVSMRSNEVSARLAPYKEGENEEEEESDTGIPCSVVSSVNGELADESGKDAKDESYPFEVATEGNLITVARKISNLSSVSLLELGHNERIIDIDSFDEDDEFNFTDTPIRSKQPKSTRASKAWAAGTDLSNSHVVQEEEKADGDIIDAADANISSSIPRRRLNQLNTQEESLDEFEIVIRAPETPATPSTKKGVRAFTSPRSYGNLVALADEHIGSSHHRRGSSLGSPTQRNKLMNALAARRSTKMLRSMKSERFMCSNDGWSVQSKMMLAARLVKLQKTIDDIRLEEEVETMLSALHVKPAAVHVEDTYDMLFQEVSRSRVVADRILNELGELHNDEERDLRLMHWFVVEQVKDKWTSWIVKKRFFGMYDDPGEVHRYVWNLSVLVMILYSLGITFYIYYFGMGLDNEAVFIWLYILALCFVEDFFLLKPFSVWVVFVVASSAISDTVKMIAYDMKRRIPHIIRRTKCVVSTYSTIIQHMNPACRAARMYPHLAVARVLIGTNDYDMPMKPLPQPKWTIGKISKFLFGGFIAFIFFLNLYFSEIMQLTIFELFASALFNFFVITCTIMQNNSTSLLVAICAVIIFTVLAREFVSHRRRVKELDRFHRIESLFVR